jgi:hypothetical protein
MDPGRVMDLRRRGRVSGGSISLFLCNFADRVNPELFFFRILIKKGNYLQVLLRKSNVANCNSLKPHVANPRF